MTATDFQRLAEAVQLLEEHRVRVRRLSEIADRLAGFDVVVVAGEQAVLERFAAVLDGCQELLTEMRTDGAASLDRLVEQVKQPGWEVLDDVQKQLAEKEQITERAREDVERSLKEWSAITNRIEAANQKIQALRLSVAEPRRLQVSRSRLSALLRQANVSFKENRFLDVWRALSELERVPDTVEGVRQLVPPRDVPGLLEELIEQDSRGVLQLTVLRGPLDDEYVEYTLMLLTSVDDQQVGINMHDRSRVLRASRERHLEEARRLEAEGYRLLRDASPPASAAPAVSEDPQRRLREMGRILYRMVIPAQIRKVIDVPDRAPLVLITNDRELSWELMCGDDFVALQRPLVRSPVGRLERRREPPAPAGQRRRVALVASAGDDPHLPHAEREVWRIEKDLNELWRDEVDIDVFMTGTEQPASGRNFEHVLVAADYDIIHYAGHAAFDSERPSRSGLVLDGPEPCSAEKIYQLMSGTPLVFLNACETARLTETEERPFLESASTGDAHEGLASAFLYGGALACIGNSAPVSDVIAAEFAGAFYSAALEGLPIGEAVRVARHTVARSNPGDLSWASFVLYGDPGIRLPVFDHVSPRRMPE